LRFAVRRPATRPASPRGHRPPGGDVLALRAGPEGGLAGITDASLAERTRNDGVRDLPPYGRMSLARVLLGPEGADLDLVPPTGRARDHRAPAGPAPVRPVLTGVLTGTADGPWAPAANDMWSGPAVAGEDLEVLTPTRVMAGRPAAWASGETDHRLGETTGTLLLRHLAKDAPRPPGRPGLSRPPVLDAPSTIPEIPRRERRPLTGRKAGVLTPRTR
jgi:hypothetical protein